MSAADEKQQIIDLMQGFTIETTPGSAAKIADYREHLRPGTMVAVTFLPGSDFADTVKVAKRLRDEGFEPAPHFAARSIASKLDFESNLERVVGEAGVTQVVALAGGVDTPLGPFDSSMGLLETGLFDRLGIKKIGVAGHPEGSPDISDEDVAAALAWKNSFAERTDAHVYICTQFCFESEPIIAWDKAIQAEGNRLPIHLGVPGLATLKTLIAYAKSSGVGNSIRFLTKQARQVTRLLTVNAPDQLVRELARYKAEDPKCGITQVHMYPLGGMRRSAAWSYAVLDGDFTITRKGFELNRDIG
ncbi:MAG: methylenetetrahydrofolate reductase [Pseudomonadota bacterium]